MANEREPMFTGNPKPVSKIDPVVVRMKRSKVNCRSKKTTCRSKKCLARCRSRTSRIAALNKIRRVKSRRNFKAKSHARRGPLKGVRFRHLRGRGSSRRGPRILQSRSRSRARSRSRKRSCKTSQRRRKKTPCNNSQCETRVTKECYNKAKGKACSNKKCRCVKKCKSGAKCSKKKADSS